MPGLEKTLEMTILIRAINQTTGAFGGVRLAALATLGAIGAGLAYGIKQAADYQTGITVLSTGAGEYAKNLQMVSNGIKQISIDTGTTTDQLLKGAFMIESASYHGQDALNVLKVAAQGAKLENTDLGATANTLTSLLHDYGMASTQAGAAMSGLIETEASGKMHMSDLTKSLGNVLPLASALKISFPEIGAAIAVMTNSGMTAQRATQNLNFLLRALAAPGAKAVDAMQAVGLSQQQVKDTLVGPDGLVNAVTLIETAIGKTFPQSSVEYTTALKDIMGGATGWNTALKLSGDHLKEQQKDITNISAAMGNSTTLTSKWAQMQGTFNFQLDQTKAALNVAAIDVGTVLIPVLEKALAAVAPLIGQFTNWVETSPAFQNAVNNVATSIGNAAQATGNFVQWTIGLYQAFQQGQQVVTGFTIALVGLGVAIAGIKILDFMAGIASTLSEITSLGGLINALGRSIMANLLPGLTMAIAEFSVLTGISMTAITLGLAGVTAGVSLLAGAFIIALIQGQNMLSGMTKKTQQAYDALGNSAQDAAMKQKAQSGDAIAQAEVQQQAVEDTAAKQKAAATTSQVSWQASAMNTQQNMTATSAAIQVTWAKLTGQSQQQALQSASHWKVAADDSSGRWQVAGEQMAKNMSNATAQMILDQQRVRDAAARDAAAAADSWSNFVSQMHQQGIDPINGGKWNPSVPSTPQHGRVAPRSTNNADQSWNVGHASGIMNSPYGHWATVGERGPELMYVPKGSNIYPNGTVPGGGGHTINVFVSTMAGSRAEVMRMVDLLESEIAHRFRSQTPSFALPGLT